MVVEWADSHTAWGDSYHLTVAALMGHADGKMVASVYSHMGTAADHLRKTIKGESIRVSVSLSLEDARRIVRDYVDYYNTVRLHSAIGYITPKDKLEGRDVAIFAARDKKLVAARERRAQLRQRVVTDGGVECQRVVTDASTECQRVDTARLRGGEIAPGYRGGVEVARRRSREVAASRLVPIARQHAWDGSLFQCESGEERVPLFRVRSVGQRVGSVGEGNETNALRHGPRSVRTTGHRTAATHSGAT